MQFNIYSVHDTVAKAFLPPFFLQSDDVARRAFADCVNDPNHSFSRHSSDYCLYKIGTFDDVTAIIQPLDVIENMGFALNYKRGE